MLHGYPCASHHVSVYFPALRRPAHFPCSSPRKSETQYISNRPWFRRRSGSSRRRHACSCLLSPIWQPAKATESTRRRFSIKTAILQSNALQTRCTNRKLSKFLKSGTVIHIIVKDLTPALRYFGSEEIIKRPLSCTCLPARLMSGGIAMGLLYWPTVSIAMTMQDTSQQKSKRWRYVANNHLAQISRARFSLKVCIPTPLVQLERQPLPRPLQPAAWRTLHFVSYH